MADTNITTSIPFESGFTELIMKALISAAFESPGTVTSTYRDPNGAVSTTYNASPLQSVLKVIEIGILKDQDRLRTVLWDAISQRLDVIADALVPRLVEAATHRVRSGYDSNPEMKLADWLVLPMQQAIAEAVRPIAEKVVAEKLGDAVSISDIEAKVKIQIVS